MDEADRQSITLYLDEMKDARYAGDMPQAYEMAEAVERTFSKYGPETALPLRSKFLYELAFLLNDDAQYRKAAEKFRESGHIANQGGDKLRWLVGEFRYTLTLYTSGQLPRPEVYQQFLQLHRGHTQLTDVPEPDRGFQAGSVLNLIKRLTEVSFDLGLASDFARWSDTLFELPDMIKNREDPIAAYELLYVQTLVRKAFVAEDWLLAVQLLIPHLEFDIPGVEPDIRVRNLPDVISFAHNDTQEIARDYRDLGRSILRTDIQDRRKIAVKVWEIGLRIRSSHGNYVFQQEIEADLGKLKETDDKRS